MPFLRAGFNAKHRRTGIFAWTRPASGGRFDCAELIEFTAGDLVWYVKRGRHGDVLAWGEQCVFGSWRDFDLKPEWQEGLEQSKLNMARQERPLRARLELPYPISSNRYWRSFAYIDRASGKPRSVTAPSDEAKAYKEHVGWIAKAAGFRTPTTKLIEIASILLCPRTNKDGSASGTVLDLGNCWKVVEDALQGIVYVNDRQIKRIRNVEYGPPSSEGGLIIEIAEFEHAAAPLFAETEEVSA